jgi:hypothetical protein
VRVARNGAVIAMAVEYSTLREEDEIALAGYALSR